LSAYGTLKGIVAITAEGQSDAMIRGLFRTSSKTQWNQIIEKELLKVSTFAEVTKIEFSDPIDYSSGPINIKIEYRIPQYGLVSGDRIMFTPVIAEGVFKAIQPHLSFDTGTKDRKYPFRDRCSRLVELNETITIPVKKMILLPDDQNKQGAICSFSGGYQLNGNILSLHEKIILGKRIYDAADWPEFREVVNAQNSYAEQPVIFQIRN